MKERIAISLTVSGLSSLYRDDVAGVVETARIADAVGIEQIVMTDHLMIGPRTDRYPYGRFPFGNDEPWPEPLTTLAAIAGATSRIRLGTGILIVPLRSPLLLAKTIATLDVLSRGRVDLGVGTGWQREEFTASGIAFSGRGERMMDTLRACRVLWRDAPATFQSTTCSFDEVWCLPRPQQPEGIPIWFGLALGPRTVERIVEIGTGWAPLGLTDEELATGIETLRAGFAEAGRDPETLGVRIGAPIGLDRDGRPDLDRTLAQLGALQEQGATVASFALAAFAHRPEDVRPFLERLGRR